MTNEQKTTTDDGKYTASSLSLLQILTLIGVFGLVLTWVLQHYYA